MIHSLAPFRKMECEQKCIEEQNMNSTLQEYSHFRTIHLKKKSRRVRRNSKRNELIIKRSHFNTINVKLRLTIINLTSVWYTYILIILFLGELCARRSKTSDARARTEGNKINILRNHRCQAYNRARPQSIESMVQYSKRPVIGDLPEIGSRR